MIAGAYCHPLMATLLNIEHSVRIKNLRHVAFLPKIENNDNWPNDTFRLIKLSVYSKVLQQILAPMKQASRECEYPRTWTDGCPEFSARTTEPAVQNVHPCLLTPELFCSYIRHRYLTGVHDVSGLFEDRRDKPLVHHVCK